MDPNANLDEQRRITAEIMKLWDACPDDGQFTDDQQRQLSHLAYELAELVQALDGWITGRGFLPALWKVRR